MNIYFLNNYYYFIVSSILNAILIFKFIYNTSYPSYSNPISIISFTQSSYYTTSFYYYYHLIKNIHIYYLQQNYFTLIISFFILVQKIISQLTILNFIQIMAYFIYNHVLNCNHQFSK